MQPILTILSARVGLICLYIVHVYLAYLYWSIVQYTSDLYQLQTMNRQRHYLLFYLKTSTYETNQFRFYAVLFYAVDVVFSQLSEASFTS